MKDEKNIKKYHVVKITLTIDENLFSALKHPGNLDLYYFLHG